MNELVFLAYIGLLGLALGSFFSMAEYRIATRTKGAFFGRSVCPKCSKQIKASHLIPLIGFLIQKGKCKNCNERISSKYIAIEAVTALALIVVASQNMPALESFESLAVFAKQNSKLLISLTATSVLIFLGYYDYFHKIILDRVAFPAIALLTILIPFNPAVSTTEALVGGGVGISFFLIQILISKGKWVGGGDMRIAAIMGIVLGWQQLLVALFLSYCIGTATCIPLLIKGKRNMEIPFAPLLAFGAILTIAFGDIILDWYLRLI